MGKLVYRVSYWYLPGGYDVVHAISKIKEFDSYKKAEDFVEQNKNPPEMAVMLDPIVKN